MAGYSMQDYALTLAIYSCISRIEDLTDEYYKPQ